MRIAWCLSILLFASAANAQDLPHVIPWESAPTCVRLEGGRSRSEVDALVAAARRGELSAPALELIAGCEVPRREIAQAFNEGGLARHTAGSYTESAALFWQAVFADPSYLAARFNLACAHARRGSPPAAIGEIGELARAGADAQRWLRRVRTDPDLATIRDDEQVAGYLQGSANYQFPPYAVSNLPLPSATGPVWQPIERADWSSLRELLITSGHFRDRRGFQPARAVTLSHSELASLETFTAPAFWRPSPGVVFLVVPFSIPGDNHRDGMLIAWWNGSAYARACHEYCNYLSDPRDREARYRDGDRAIRVVRCDEGARSCVSHRIVADGHVLRHGGGRVIEGVTTP